MGDVLHTALLQWSLTNPFSSNIIIVGLNKTHKAGLLPLVDWLWEAQGTTWVSICFFTYSWWPQFEKKNSIVSWEYKMLLRGGVIWLESCVCVCVDVLMPTGFPGGSEVKASACNAGDIGLIPGLGRSPGEGNGNPLQYSCLENLMDGGAWQATVHGVTKSRTRLSDFTFTFTSSRRMSKRRLRPKGERVCCWSRREMLRVWTK